MEPNHVVKDIATLPITIFTGVLKSIVYSVLFVTTCVASTAFLSGVTKAAKHKELTKDVPGISHIYKYSEKGGEKIVDVFKKKKYN